MKVTKPEDLGEKALTELLTDITKFVTSLPDSVVLDSNLSYHTLHNDTDQIMFSKITWSHSFDKGIVIHEVLLYDSQEDWDEEIRGVKN